jgi:Xaa-Pro aminopeptidase
MSSIIAEKVGQAARLLDELGIDLWLTFARETVDGGDPVLPIILGHNLTWQSALMITRTGERVAIVGKYDDGAVRSTGVWSNTTAYVQSIREPLLDTLRRLDPKQIAINYSRDDVKADGLSHGMFLLLNDYLSETPYADRLVGADRIIEALRGRKTNGEVKRIRQAIDTSLQILESVGGFAKPGVTEIEVADFMKRQTRERNVELAWDPVHCPIVNTGPESMVGHGIPSSLVIEPGDIFHIDFGVMQDGYCADLQRCWYVPASNETEPPEAVRRECELVVKAIRAAAAVLKPGVEGWQVDAAARKVVTDAGHTEYQHATGHSVGRSAHDGGGILGPRWERYGQTPYRKVEPGNVFTLELGIENVDGRGYLGLEEMVVVTADGCEFLSTPQTSLPLLG